jgi:hypothetical protein
MSELAVEDVTPAAVHEAASGQVVYIIEHGTRIAAIVPPEVLTELEQAMAERAGYEQLAAAHAAEDAERRQIARRRRPAWADED